MTETPVWLWCLSIWLVPTLPRRSVFSVIKCDSGEITGRYNWRSRSRDNILDGRVIFEALFSSFHHTTTLDGEPFTHMSKSYVRDVLVRSPPAFTAHPHYCFYCYLHWLWRRGNFPLRCFYIFFSAPVARTESFSTKRAQNWSRQNIEAEGPPESANIISKFSERIVEDLHSSWDHTWSNEEVPIWVERERFKSSTKEVNLHSVISVESSLVAL